MIVSNPEQRLAELEAEVANLRTLLFPHPVAVVTQQPFDKTLVWHTRDSWEGFPVGTVLFAAVPSKCYDQRRL